MVSFGRQRDKETEERKDEFEVIIGEEERKCRSLEERRDQSRIITLEFLMFKFPSYKRDRLEDKCVRLVDDSRGRISYIEVHFQRLIDGSRRAVS